MPSFLNIILRRQGRDRNGASIIWMCCALPLITALAPAQDVVPRATAAPRVAVLNLDRSAEGELLESHLRRDGNLQWWPRQKTQELVKSLALSTRIDFPVLEPDALDESDAPPLLIIVTTLTREAQKFLHVVVCDPDQGVRLGAQRLPLAAGAAIDIAALARGVQQSLDRRSGWREIWAAPPFLSRDLTREFDDLSLQYAAELESVLLTRPGAVAVEFEHAAVIDAARRAAGRTAPIERPTPAYLVGDYRNKGSADERRLTVNIKLIRGERDELDVSSSDLAPAAAEEWIRQFAGQSGRHLSGADLLTDQPPSEHLLLTMRGEQLREAGVWEGAWRLTEAHLLLDPEQSLPRRNLLTVLNRIATRRRALAEQLSEPSTSVRLEGPTPVYSQRPNPRAPEAIAHTLYALNAQRRALQHVHHMLDGNEQARTSLLGLGTSLTQDLNVSLSTAQRVDYAGRVAILANQVVEERRAAVTRMYLEGARLGRLQFPEFLSGQTGDDCLSDALRVIVATQDFPNSEQAIRLVVERAITQTGGQTDPSGFIEQLAASPQPALQAAAKRAKELVASRAKARPTPPGGNTQEQPGGTKAVQSVRPAARPETAEPSEPAQIEFAEVKLPWNRTITIRGAQTILGEFQLCLAAGNADLFYGNGQLLLMKKRDEATTLWQADERGWTALGLSPGVPWACFDGRYAWIPLSRRGAAPRLLMVDAQEEKVVEWTRDDGLPLVADEAGSVNQPAALVVTALGPGKVCIAGSAGRGWLATATYDPEKGKSAKVFFEARLEPIQANERETFKRTLAFRPLYIYTLAGRLDEQPPSQRVIVGRSTGHHHASEHPLLVDPATGAVEVVQSPLKTFILPYATPRGDSLYWATTEYVYDRATQQQKRETRVFRLGYPDFQQQLVVNHGEIGGRQMMKLGFTESAMHCLGNPWLTATAPDQPLRPLRGTLPELPGPYDWLLAPSAHYGWLIYKPAQGRAWAAILKEDAARSPADAGQQPDQAP